MQHLLTGFILLAALVSPMTHAHPTIRALTSFEGEDREPALSPNGEWLAYLSDRKGNRSNELWLLNVTTGTERRLYDQMPVLGPPVWTKDGHHLIVSIQNDHNPARLHSINIETGVADKILLPAFAESGDQLFPDVSADGRTLALTVRTDEGKLDLFLATLPDGNVNRLTDNPQNDLWPRFDKTGAGIYFFSRRATEGQSDDIFYLALASRQITRLTQAEDHDFVPSLSPDGQFIAFASRRSGNPELFVMSKDGRNERKIETPGLRITHPVWSQNGTQIYFTGRPLEGGPADIYVATLP